jgi:hypothetical protein
MLRIARKEYSSFELQAEEDNTLQSIMRAIRTAFSETEDYDYVVKVIESLIVFCMQFNRAKNLSDFMLAMTALLQSTTKMSLSGRVVSLYAKAFAGDFSDFTVQSDGDFWSCLDRARDGIDFFQSIKDFPLMKKLHKFALFVLSHSLFENAGIFFDMMGYSELEQVSQEDPFIQDGFLLLLIRLCDLCVAACPSGTFVEVVGAILPQCEGI